MLFCIIIIMFVNIGPFSYLHWRVISCCLLSVLYYEKQISIGCKQGWLRQNRSIETLIEPELACPPSVVPVLMQLHSEQGRNISLRCAVSGQWYQTWTPARVVMVNTSPPQPSHSKLYLWYLLFIMKKDKKISFE